MSSAAIGRLAAPMLPFGQKSRGGGLSLQPAALTDRERVVITLVRQGMTAVAIAHRLGISPRTVHKHLENVYAKLGVGDRLSAVLLVQEATMRTGR